MKSVALIAVGLLIGAFGFWGMQFLQGDGAEPSQVEEAVAGSSPSDMAGAPETVLNAPPGPPRPRLIGGPLFGDDGFGDDGFDDVALGTGEGATSVAPSSTAPSQSRVVPRPIESQPTTQNTGTGRVDAERRLAIKSYDSGETDLGRRLLADVYNAHSDNSKFDLTPEVERLLPEETNFVRRREYLLYLGRRSSVEKLFTDQFERARVTSADSLSDSSTASDAWSELSLAYELAPTVGQRGEVFVVLQPLLEQYVFSGRASPLLTTYIVKPGDNLSSIAVRFRSTVRAIRRLNRLKSDMIKVKQRLRILSGKMRIYVDKSDYRLWATVDHRLLLERSVGLGSENSTPVGEFVVTVREVDPVWWRPGEPPIPSGDERNILGSRWLGFKETVDFSGYGIHGTTDPASIGQQASAGCVRMLNEDVELLYDFVAAKTPVQIIE